MTLQQEVETARGFGISPHSFVADIEAVRYGGRAAAAVFTDEIGLTGSINGKTFTSFLNAVKNNSRMVDAKRYLKTFGFKSDVVQQIVYPLNALPSLLYFSKEGTFYAKTDRLNRLYELASRNESERRMEDYLMAVAEEGKLLGYPECCTAAFAEQRKAAYEGRGKQREIYLAEQMQKHVKVCGGKLELDKEVLPAFFTFEFYPCDPTCEASKNIGKKVIALFEETDRTLAAVYKDVVLPYNMFKVSFPPFFIGSQLGNYLGLMDEEISTFLLGREPLILRRRAL